MHTCMFVFTIGVHPGHFLSVSDYIPSLHPFMHFHFLVFQALHYDRQSVSQETSVVNN